MIPSILFAFIPLVLAKDHMQRSTRHHQPKSLVGGFELTHDMIQARLNSFSANSTDLQKRGYSGRASFYDVGLGACGEYNSDSEFVVALNQGQYGSLSSVSKYCFKWINIQYGGKSAKAQIVDACPGCPWGALDMSPSLFSHFADQDMGIFYMSWGLVGESDDGGEQTTSKKPTSTSYWHASTTSSKWVAPTTTSYWQEPTTTSYYSYSSSSSYSNSSISASQSTVANSTASGNATATATGLASLPAEDFDYEDGALYAVNQVVLGFTGLSGAILQEKADAIAN